MFKELKLQAKTNILKNYKYIFIPIVLYELFSSVVTSIFDFGFFNKHGFLALSITVISLIVFKFILLPIIVIVYFRIGVYILDGKSISLSVVMKLLTCKNIIKIVAVSFTPNIIDLFYSLIKFFEAEFNSFLIYYLLVFISLITKYYVEYKFFVCNYHLASTNFSSKEILKFSFETMKGKFPNYIIYDISFVLWDLLIAMVGVVCILVLNSVNIETIYFRFAVSAGFGLMFFYRPYRFFSNLLYAKEKTGEKTGDGSVSG